MVLENRHSFHYCRAEELKGLPPRLCHCRPKAETVFRTSVPVIGAVHRFRLPLDRKMKESPIIPTLRTACLTAVAIVPR
ncbi:MAG: hypothetical protein ACLT38_04755 [Akkermansia sp.]